MSIIGNNILAGASGGAAATYEIDRSLRFVRADNNYLNFTPSSAGNQKTWTWSVWVKRSSLYDHTDNQGIHYLFSPVRGGDGFNEALIRFDTHDTLKIYDSGGTRGHLSTNRKFRDTSAWYHIVVVLDTPQATPADRLKLYVNGVQETSFSTETYPAQDTTWGWNGTQRHDLGRYGLYEYEWFDGYMAEVNFIDGTALAASDFGETDTGTGAWIPKQYSGSYGSQGWYLNFADNSNNTATTLGKDNSGNSNNWTPNSFSVSAGNANDSVVDSPTNNYSTLNVLDRTGGNMFQGNLNYAGTYSSVVSRNGHGIRSTLRVPSSGKWYVEAANITYAGAGNSCLLGFTQSTSLTSSVTAFGGTLTPWIGVDANVYGNKIALNWNGVSGGTASATTLFSSYASGDIVNFAIDFDNGKFWVGKNGTWYNSGDPAAGTNATSTFTAGSEPWGFWAEYVASSNNANRSQPRVNFGQQGHEYTAPAGFLDINTANLPVPTIKNGTKYMQTVLYTGNQATRNIAVADNQGSSWSPDWVWIKGRATTSTPTLFDTIRGATNYLRSDTNAVETSDADTLTEFRSDGFSLGADLKVNTTGTAYVSWNWDAGDNSSKTFTVKVVSDSGNKYRFDDFGTSAVTLDLEEGSTYVFDQSDSSNSGHPLRFSTTSDGTHGSGSEYTTGVTTTGTPGSAGAKTTIVVAASAPTLYYYCSVHSGMGGQANTNSTAGASNFDGNIQSTVRTSAEAGFSIVRYTGDGTDANSNTVTVGHQLGVKPDLIITKKITSGNDYNWSTWHKDLGAGYGIFLDLHNARNAAMWDGDSNHSSTVFSPADSLYNNESGKDYINYVFTSVEGYSKFGSYTGNALSGHQGPFIFLGFRPKWVLIKSSTVATSWYLMDDTRESIQTQGSDANVLFPDTAAGDQANAGQGIDFLSNGFKVQAANGYGLNNSATYIFLAFAEIPTKYSNAR